MPLSDRFKQKPSSGDPRLSPEEAAKKALLQDIKFRFHNLMIDRLDLEALSHLPVEEARKQVADLVKKLISEEKVPLNALLQVDLIKDVVNETFGLGPLEPLLAKSTVDEILVNGPHQVYIEQQGKLTLTNISFKDDQHLRHVINRIVSAVGRRIDESNPRYHSPTRAYGEPP